MSRPTRPIPPEDVIEREREALALRRGGATYQGIATRIEGFGGNSGTAYRAVQRALRRTLQEPADDLRTLELERLDALHLAMWTKAMGGSLGAVDRVLRIAERRARLLGLDAPIRIDGRLMDATTAEVQELADELERQAFAAGVDVSVPPREAV